VESIQRVLAALEGQEPDRVPVYDVFNEDTLYRLAELLEWEIEEQQEDFVAPYLLVRVADELGLDFIDWIPSMGEEPIDETHIRDRFGIVYATSRYGDPVVVEGPVKDFSDLRGLDMAARAEPDDFGSLRYLVERIGGTKLVGLGCTDPFRISWSLRGGMQSLLLDYATDKQLVHGLARVSTDLILSQIEASCEAGVKAIVMDGDLASEQNTLMSPIHYREYVRPYQSELVDSAHRHGMKIIKHSDGNMWPILEDLIEIGFDGFHPIQPQCMDISQVKEFAAGRICLVGNIDCRELLCSGTEDDVAEAVKKTIEIASPGGGYILSSSNSIHPGVRLQNFIAMVRAAHEYGSYSS
jgi:uroporphyrinogen decarboxylase